MAGWVYYSLHGSYIRYERGHDDEVKKSYEGKI